MKHSNLQLPSSNLYSFSMPETASVRTPSGLSESTVQKISAHKNEPLWMANLRLSALKIFSSMPLPKWASGIDGLDQIDFNKINYFVSPTDKPETSWEALPKEIKTTFDRLGIPEAEKKYLAGVGGQYDSSVVYHSIQEKLKKLGVIFCDPETGLREHEELFRQYFGKVVPAADNKFAALNTACWSGGSFIYVPKGVHVDLPLQAYFRINAERMGQFERTLIIADEGSFVHYSEGCTAPSYTTQSLHSAVVEIIVKPGARVRYTTIQNWSKNVYNLVTKRARVEANGIMEWVDFNGGSRLTCKYPSCFLVGPGAHGEILSLAMAGAGQHQDAGGKAVHMAPNTTSRIISKSLSFNGGRTSYRGLVKVTPDATGAKSHVVCDALLLDEQSRSDTYPTMDVQENTATIEHEATVAKIGEEQLFYLQSRGLSESDARSLIVHGFMEPIVKTLPMEYAVELNRLVDMEMEGAVG